MPSIKNALGSKRELRHLEKNEFESQAVCSKGTENFQFDISAARERNIHQSEILSDRLSRNQEKQDL